MYFRYKNLLLSKENNWGCGDGSVIKRASQVSMRTGVLISSTPIKTQARLHVSYRYL